MTVAHAKQGIWMPFFNKKFTQKISVLLSCACISGSACAEFFMLPNAAAKKESVSVPPAGGVQPVQTEAIKVEPTIKSVQVWTLVAGHTNGQDLQEWGKKAGWKVVWDIQHDWSVPATTSFSGDFQTAAADVIKTLSANGALVRAKFYVGNKTMVVTGPGASSQ